MDLWELCLVAVGLAMDAFAVSLCKGLSVRALRLRHALLCGAYFGVFQALMPLAGYFLGARFRDLITAVDHWIAFALLGVIGANMIREAFSGDEDAHNDSFAVRTMLLLAVATSIDAFAVGITFAFLGVNIAAAVLIIGLITFLLSAVGVKIGNVFGEKFKARAEILGGVVLILMGTKILLEHLGLIG